MESGRREEAKEVFFMFSKKLYVGNLNYKTTDEKLKEVFSQFGEVTSVNILQGRGFGFVEMATSEASEEAKNRMNGTDFEGRKIIVNEARPRTDNPKERREGGDRKDFRKF
jgi:RNA recognition motif-containing protein